MAKNQQVLRTHQDIKAFNYNKGKVALNFSLRVDIKSDLRDFKELLEAALVDVDKELTNH